MSEGPTQPIELTTRAPGPVAAHVMALTSAVCWSLIFALIRYLRHDEQIDPIGIYLLRYDLIAVIVLAVWVVRRPKLGGLGGVTLKALLQALAFNQQPFQAIV